MKQIAIDIRGELASVRGMHGTTTCDDISKQAEKKTEEYNLQRKV
jgi:hypothetical protein